MQKGIKFVRKARTWLYFEKYNRKSKEDIEEWFDTQEQAVARLNETEDKS